MSIEVRNYWGINLYTIPGVEDEDKDHTISIGKNYAEGTGPDPYYVRIDSYLNDTTLSIGLSEEQMMEFFMSYLAVKEEYERDSSD